MSQGHVDKKRAKKRGGGGGKLSLKTSSKDYDGNLGLPEKVAQREFETTGQFMRRLDRLVAKAKVEASLETRFDMTLKGKKMKNKDNEDEIVEKLSKKYKRKQPTRRRKNNNGLDDDIVDGGGGRGRDVDRKKKFRKGGKGGGGKRR